MDWINDLRNNELLARLVIKCVRRIGPKSFKDISDKVGSGRNLFLLDRRELMVELGFGSDQVEDLFNGGHYQSALDELSEARKHNICILTPESNFFPKAFMQIENPPIVLYIKGSLVEGLKRIAVVGTRRPTYNGLKTAGRFSRVIAENGIEVVSGLARGIDTASHEGAVESKSRTIAVLGSGLLSVYPRENRTLSEKISLNGALISEFPLYAKPMDYHFPLRNRLISAYSDALTIIEAPKKSGALITAEHALQQGREVFVVPGSIYDKESEGSNELLKEGASCVTAAEEIIFSMGWTNMRHRNSNLSADNPCPSENLELWEALAARPCSSEDLLAISKYPVDALLSKLTEWEASGYIKRLSDRRFVKASYEN